MASMVPGGTGSPVANRATTTGTPSPKPCWIATRSVLTHSVFSPAFTVATESASATAYSETSGDSEASTAIAGENVRAGTGGGDRMGNGGGNADDRTMSATGGGAAKAFRDGGAGRDETRAGGGGSVDAALARGGGGGRARSAGADDTRCGKGGATEWLGGAGIGVGARRRGGVAGAIERGGVGGAAGGDCDAASARGGDEEGRGGAGRPGASPLVAADDGACDRIGRRSLVFECITADCSLASADATVAAAITFSLLTLAIIEDVPFLFADWKDERSRRCRLGPSRNESKTGTIHPRRLPWMRMRHFAYRSHGDRFVVVSAIATRPEKGTSSADCSRLDGAQRGEKWHRV